ncbi:hypothetical protein CSB11_01355 [Candidatus Campbellbacteria bacterium]|nr:MAG: hypothetical protein CSB11_01355 [Candidatus Campbellbacteria bacterium]
MARKNKKVILNLDSREFVLKKDVTKTFNLIKKESQKYKNFKFVLSLPENFLFFLKEKYVGKKILFAARTNYKDKNDFCGSSLETLSDFKINYNFIYDNKQDEFYDLSKINCNQKIQKILKTKVDPILIIGESKRDNAGNFVDELQKQIKTNLKNIDTRYLENINLVYKPTWIDSRNKNISEEILSQTYFLIRKILFRMYQKDAEKINIFFYANLEDRKVFRHLENLNYNGVYINVDNRKNHHFFEIFKEER